MGTGDFVEKPSGAEAGGPPSMGAAYVVGLGASAGGLDALERFFDHVPEDTGLSFVVVQHLSPDFKSLMDELLARHTRMRIQRVTDAMPVEPNCIYLLPPKKNITLRGGKLALSEQNAAGLNLPIDIFFRSLAADCGPRAMAVVLSGTGSDGSRGICDVHAGGGLVVVQDPVSAAFDGMPRNALATRAVDVVAAPEEICGRLLEFARSPIEFRRSLDGSYGDDGEMSRIFRLFRARFRIDFAQYRSTTIHRRLERRYRLMRCADLREYLELLGRNPDELEALYRDLLVEVTQFLRDPAAFDRIQQEIVPAVFERAAQQGQIRVWVPGCATGEEPYSIAMLLAERAREVESTCDIKVFATDVHQSSLETASAGVYSSEAVSRVPPELRQRYFRQHGDLYHIVNELRQMVIFAPHDITSDPPFPKIDLVSCRNVLIYLDPPVQQRVISLFHFGLRVGGFLWLGPSESVGPHAREFEVVDQEWRIFRKLRDVRLPEAVSMRLSTALTNVVRTPTSLVSHAARSQPGGALAGVFEELLERYAPPSLLVNEAFELVHSFGDARRFLVQPKGRSTLDVLRMVEGDVRMAISAALHRATRENAPVRYTDVRSESLSAQSSLRIVVEPFVRQNQKLFLIILDEAPARPRPHEEVAETFAAQNETSNRIQELERELDFTKESLQTAVEKLEASNEELQSTNEELVSANEELQSTNEELQSVNEELYTVNAEHQRKIEELTQLTADMDNLLRSTEIGTIFIDRDLNIRKFTPAISAAFHVMDQDIGRPIAHIAYNLDSPRLMDDIFGVMSQGKPIEREVSSRDGKRYLKRVTPYRAVAGEMNGVVLTFTDIATLDLAERQLELVLDNVSALIAYVDCNLQYRLTNRRYAECFGKRKSEIIGRHLGEVIGPDAYQHAWPYLQRALAGQPQTFETTFVTSRGERICALVNYVSDSRHGHVDGVYMGMTDITERKRAEERFQALVEAAPTGMVMVDRSGDIVLVNAAMERLFGYSRGELVGQRIEVLLPPRQREIHLALRTSYLERPEPRQLGGGRDLFGRRKDGSEFYVEIGLNPIEVGGSLYVLGALVDISERKRMEQRYRELYAEIPVMLASVEAERWQILACTEHLLARLGREPREVVGKPVWELHHSDSQLAMREACERFRHTETGEAMDVWLADRHGQRLEVRLEISPVHNSLRRVVAWRLVWFEHGVSRPNPRSAAASLAE